MRFLGVLILAFGLLCQSASVLAFQDTTPEEVLAAIDDSTCGDGIGRTYTHEQILDNEDTTEEIIAFSQEHASCYGGVDSDLRIKINGECSPPTYVADFDYDWIICLIWFQHDLGSERIPLDLKDFALTKADGTVMPATTGINPFYAGQRDDISNGAFLTGKDGRFGLIAFPIDRADAQIPMLLAWHITGDILIIEDMEPIIGQRFLNKDWPEF